MEVPEGSEGCRKGYWKLKKALYKLKQSGRLWNEDNLIRAYVDSDFGGDETTRSTTGIIILIGTGPIGWPSKLQHIVSSSTAESEHYALGSCANQCILYENILNELGENCKPININIDNKDNKATLYISENETINQNTRHIDLKYHLVRDYIKGNKIRFHYIKSQDNLVDGFTKYLNSNAMKKFRDLIMYEF